MKQGMEESIEFLQLWTTMGKGGHKETLSGTSAKHPGQEIGEPDAKDTCPIMERADQRREKFFKSNATWRDEPGDPFARAGKPPMPPGPSPVPARQGYLLASPHIHQTRHHRT